MKPKWLLSWTVMACLVASATLASTVLGLSIEDQTRLSKLVVVGEVIGQKGVDHPGNGIESAITLKVTDVLKGKVHVGQTVVFHSRSGQVDGELSQALGEAVFQSGQSYLVFIEEIDGRLYNLGLSMGVWDVTEGLDGRPSFTRALQDGLQVMGDVTIEKGPIARQEMATRVGYAVRKPRLDHPLLQESRLERSAE
jgi:hypothetical protein